jgi:hypothetical protein
MRLPDFLIVGAMKAGTTSLHYVLSHHECIFMPDPEIFFFTIDDIQQHPDFFVENSDGWTFHDYEKNFEEYLSWYGAFFKDAKENQVVGERSTAYMASRRAPGRIAALLPDAKLIFTLRDPVDRTYSQYWHEVRVGTMIYDFEKALQYTPGILLQRSFYKEQIVRYKKYFPDINFKFVIFESFIQNPQSIVDEVCEFLGLKWSVEVNNLDTHRNRVIVPRSIGLQLVRNRIFRKVAAQVFLNSYLPNMTSNKTSTLLTMVSKMIRRANAARGKSYPPMKQRTRRFLEELFAKENRGLSELIGVSVQDYWPYIQI